MRDDWIRQLVEEGVPPHALPKRRFDWMVVRQVSFEPYWAAPATFGPMLETEARAMIAQGGHMMTVAEFVKAGYR